MTHASMLLIDSYPLMFQPELAVLTSVNEAIVIQQLHYWLKQNKDKPTHYRDGHVWCWNTYEEWRENNFPFWSVSTIKRAFTDLEARGLVIKGSFNKIPTDRTGWYTIDYQALESLTASAQVDPMDQLNLTRPSAQVDPLLPETTPETTQNSAAPVASGDEQPYFVELDTLDQYPHFKAPNFNKALKKASRFDCPGCGVKASIGVMDRVTPCCNGIIRWKNNDLLAKKIKAENTDAEAKRRRALGNQKQLTPGTSYLLMQAIATDPQHKCAYREGEADRVMAFEHDYGPDLIRDVTNAKMQENSMGRGLITTVINALPFAAKDYQKAEPENEPVAVLTDDMIKDY